jgi:hypothetical protein
MKNIIMKTKGKMAATMMAALLGLTSPTNAQNLGISETGSPPDNSALLDVDATGMNPKEGGSHSSYDDC